MNIHRYYFPGQIVFITQVIKNRQMVFNNSEMIDLLINILHKVNDYHPFLMLGYVFLPDHFHLLIRPSANCNFSQIMHSLKRNFTRIYKEKKNISGSFNFWQAGFWDHVIRDEVDFENHLHYIHYNPVKHDYVREPEDWQHSSFHVWRFRGLYDGNRKWVEPENDWGE